MRLVCGFAGKFCVLLAAENRKILEKLIAGSSPQKSDAQGFHLSIANDLNFIIGRNNFKLFSL